jgi:hypothetical protein
MSAENYLFDALESVLAWDMPDELLPLTLQSQAGLMAGIPYDEVSCCLD